MLLYQLSKVDPPTTVPSSVSDEFEEAFPTQWCPFGIPFDKIRSHSPQQHWQEGANCWKDNSLIEMETQFAERDRHVVRSGQSQEFALLTLA